MHRRMAIAEYCNMNLSCWSVTCWVRCVTMRSIVEWLLHLGLYALGSLSSSGTFHCSELRKQRGGRGRVRLRSFYPTMPLPGCFCSTGRPLEVLPHYTNRFSCSVCRRTSKVSLVRVDLGFRGLKHGINTNIDCFGSSSLFVTREKHRSVLVPGWSCQ